MFWRRIRRSYTGFKNVIAREDSVRIGFICALLAITLGLLLKINRPDFLLVLILVFLVIIFESLNTILERLIDLIEPRYKTVIGEIKDGLAGAIMLAVALAFIAGLIIFLPYLKTLPILIF